MEPFAGPSAVQTSRGPASSAPPLATQKLMIVLGPSSTGTSRPAIFVVAIRAAQVEFLCWDGVPNWLGSIVITIGIIVVFFMMVAIFAAADIDGETD